ncbi:MAG: endonuclease/exonuclease/phosphatase family protein [Verrucomicrobia bacterium]|nr:endonuclease/exonuclease/phosphatase family protein [Verrucomicrobiota bacterium]
MKCHPWLLLGGVALGLIALTLGCGRKPDAGASAIPRLDRDEFSVMSYNLYRFGYYDRDEDGQADDFKPDEEVSALLAILKATHPDVLAVQELGDEAAFDRLIALLKAEGLDYPYTQFITGFTPHAKNGLLSRYPLASVTLWTNLTYTVADTEVGVSRGFLEATIQVNEDYQFTLFNVHLKSKRFHELGQTEMRRNEARLLTQLLKDRLEENPEANLLVVGDMNDEIGSAPLRLILEEGGVTDLLLRDYVGDIWTHEWTYRQSYSRIDYLFCSPGMLAELVPEKSSVVRHPQNRKASDHRPLLGVFKASEQPRK